MASNMKWYKPIPQVDLVRNGSYAKYEFTLHLPFGAFFTWFYSSARARLELELWRHDFSYKLKLFPKPGMGWWYSSWRQRHGA